MWESAQTNSYVIKEDSTEPIEGSGTRIVLHLKEDSEEYLDDFKVRAWLLDRIFAVVFVFVTCSMLYHT